MPMYLCFKERTLVISPLKGTYVDTCILLKQRSGISAKLKQIFLFGVVQ